MIVNAQVQCLILHGKRSVAPFTPIICPPKKRTIRARLDLVTLTLETFRSMRCQVNAPLTSSLIDICFCTLGWVLGEVGSARPDLGGGDKIMGEKAVQVHGSVKYGRKTKAAGHGKVCVVLGPPSPTRKETSNHDCDGHKILLLLFLELPQLLKKCGWLQGPPYHHAAERPPHRVSRKEHTEAV